MFDAYFDRHLRALGFREGKIKRHLWDKRYREK